MKYSMLVVLAACSTLVGCGEDRNTVVGPSVVVADGGKVRAADVTPTSTATATATVTAAPTPTNTPIPPPISDGPWPAPTATEAPIMPPTVAGVHNPDVFKTVDTAPCVAIDKGGYVDSMVVVDGANTGKSAAVSVVWFNVDKSINREAPVTTFTSGLYPVRTYYGEPKPTWIQFTAQVDGITYVSDTCAIL